jgi:hypothetical protein
MRIPLPIRLLIVAIATRLRADKLGYLDKDEDLRLELTGDRIAQAIRDRKIGCPNCGSTNLTGRVRSI